MSDQPADREMMTLRVRSKDEIAKGIFQFELCDPSGGELPPFTAGSHLTVAAPSGQRRRYSLTNDPNERDRYVLAIKHEANGRGGSQSMVTDVHAGGDLAVSWPSNNFEMSRTTPRSYLFIAGGIGITPIRSMIRHLLTEGKGNFRLLYFTRTPTLTAFREELSAPQFKGKVVIHHDEGDPNKAYDLWSVLENPMGAHLYCCGPQPLMDAVRDMTGHWTGDALHFEDFGAVVASRVDDTPFKVRLARTGETIEVPAGISILDALRKRGHILPSSCESGTCGTCRIHYLDGEPDHRDRVLSDRQREEDVMICVSRAKSDELVLDI